MNCIALIIWLFSNGTPGDSTSPWRFQHVDKSAKLSNSAITSVYMDRHDYVWLGTWDGLNQYDGSSIKVFKPDPFQEGTISNNVIRNFLEDARGNLWVVTHSGINRYDRLTNKFHVYLDSIPDIPLLENNIRACIGPDGVVWVSLIGKGISHYSEKTDQFQPVDFQGLEREWFASVVDLSEQNGLLYLLGSDGKLVCTVNNRFVFNKKIIDAAELHFHKFLKIGKKTYLAIVNKRKQLLIFDVSNPEKAPVIQNLGNAIISSISESRTQTYAWLGSESGDVFKLEPMGKRSLLRR